MAHVVQLMRAAPYYPDVWPGEHYKLLAESNLQDVPSGAVIVFTNDQVRLRDEGCSLPLARLASLEDVLSRLVGKGQNVALNQGRVRAVQKVFDDRMRAARAWR